MSEQGKWQVQIARNMNARPGNDRADQDHPPQPPLVRSCLVIVNSSETRPALKEKKFYNVVKEIQSLKQRIMDISRKRETYGITNINNDGEGPSNQSAMVRKLRRTTSYVDDQDYIFVGLQDVGLNEWQKVKDHLWKNIKEDKSIEIYNILSLSYNDLSTALKQCFLYFGIFPQDQVLGADNIIWLWMAEGFIPRGEERMEDVAEGFLNELIRRSLVQVATYRERFTKCRVHDLLHDLAIQKAMEVNFFHIYDPRSHSISSLYIRHVIHSQGERSVFQHLYVLYLHMHGGNMSIVPDAIGSLYHLKFLRLRGIQGLPSSIGNLKNLQTLYVNDSTQYCELPHETADLINLKHLVSLYSKPLEQISKLTSLQVLQNICCDQWKDVDPVDLVNLRELSMHYITKSYSLNNIRCLKNLSTLRLLCCADESFPSLEFVNCCEKLQKLRLEGRIEKLPHLFPNPITTMVLRFSVLTEDPMPILGILPNLRNLNLLRAYEGKEIMCSDNSFSQLEFHRLYDLEKLERWDLGTSAMPLIKREAWENLKRAFPDSKNGRRGIITTPKEDVVERADDRGFVHKLRFLSHEESWDLFCRKLLDVRAMTSAMERLASYGYGGQV
ncbi:hypothetical protein KY284_022157 [Solanum tuberosum]|nr:hypothetical protein KY284_022157 [Solanum tuberosum]